MLIKKSRKIFLYILFLIGFTIFNNKYFNNLNFPTINEFKITGLNRDTEIMLQKKLQKYLSKNIFNLKNSDIESTINSFDIIDKYSIFKKYPKSLEIKVEEAEFLAITKIDSKNYFLGSNGKLIKSNKNEKYTPFIFGNFDNKDFFEMKKKIDSSNLNYKEIKNLFFFPSKRVDIELENGVIIKLPNSNIKESLNLSLDLLKKDNFEEVKLIDVRQSNQVIVNE